MAYIEHAACCIDLFLAIHASAGCCQDEAAACADAKAAISGDMPDHTA